MRSGVHLLILATLVGGGLLAGGCGSSGRAAPPRQATVVVPARVPPLTHAAPRRLVHRRPAPRRPVRRHSRPALHGPGVGATQQTQSRGSRLAVTVERLIDPLVGSGAAVLRGSRAVGVVVRLVNAGPALYDSSATGDFSVISSGGPVTPVFVPRGICQTPVEDFDRYMNSGDERAGCVAFAVPAHARVLAVRFTPHAAAKGQLTWLPR